MAEDPTNPAKVPSAAARGLSSSLVGGVRVGARLAEGAFGVVYRGVDEASGQPVAVKLLHAHWLDDPRIVDRFEREAELLTRVRHPNIVQVLQAGCSDGVPYLVMEWLDGPDLDHLLATRGRLSEGDTVLVTAKLCDALEACHSASIVHRDLKGSNVLFPHGAIDQPKLIDFGIAKIIAADASSSLSSTGAIIGSPSTMAPEQILGQAVDARTDVYALGVLMFTMLAGRLPFVASKAEDVEAMHLYSPPPRLGDEVAVSDALEEVVLACLRKEREARPASVADVAARLAHL